MADDAKGEFCETSSNISKTKRRQRPCRKTPSQAALQRAGPITYKLYSAFLDYLLRKKIPDEEYLIDAGLTVSASSSYQWLSTSVSPSICDVAPDRQEGKEESVAPTEFAHEASDKDNLQNEPKLEKDHMVPQENLGLKNSASSDAGYKPSKRENSSKTEEGLKVPLPRCREAFDGGSMPPSSTSASSLCDINPTAKVVKGPNSRRLKFTAWARRMYVNINMKSEAKAFQVVSLNSKRSHKEIIPSESYKDVVMKVHTQSGLPGQFHLSTHLTIVAYKLLYTFGRRDFGISEQTLKRIVARCPIPNCAANSKLNFKGKDAAVIFQVPPGCSPSLDNTWYLTLLQDPFYAGNVCLCLLCLKVSILFLTY